MKKRFSDNSVTKRGMISTAYNVICHCRKKTWMIGPTVEEDDKVVRGPRVLIEVDQHLQHDHEDDIGDGGDGDVGNEHLSPVEDGRVGLHLRDWVLGVEDVNDRHSAFRRRRIPKN